jgi:hypothetical protein
VATAGTEPEIFRIQASVLLQMADLVAKLNKTVTSANTLTTNHVGTIELSAETSSVSYKPQRMDVSRDISVGTATGYWLGGWGSIPGRSRRPFSSPQSRPDLAYTPPLVQWVPWTVYPGEKRPGSEADHSPPSSAEDQNGGAVPPLRPPKIFMV